MQWRDSPDYLYGVDLFNNGYYWEAHEAWEGLWRAAGKVGVTAEFLKGLIKLTAAAIKIREGRSVGAVHLAEGAIGHLEHVAASSGSPTYAGLEIASAIRTAEGIRSSVRDGTPRSSPIVADPMVLGNG
jgi:predicted metal-dependent hydrolase